MDGVNCPVCDQEGESVAHLFWGCPLARRVWRVSPLHLDLGGIFRLVLSLNCGMCYMLGGEL